VLVPLIKALMIEPLSPQVVPRFYRPQGKFRRCTKPPQAQPLNEF